LTYVNLLSDYLTVFVVFFYLSLAMPMEIPSLPPPVGFQLVRDPSTGQFLFLPAATTIGKTIRHLIIVVVAFAIVRVQDLWDRTRLWWAEVFSTLETLFRRYFLCSIMTRAIKTVHYLKTLLNVSV
jgi:hypothetical protein